jgi:DNA-directed RNA polymerase I, II, and III subunit RPABC2
MSDNENYSTDASDNEDNGYSDDEKIITKKVGGTIEDIESSSDEEEEEEPEVGDKIADDEDDYYDEQAGGESEDVSEDDDDDDEDESENEDISSSPAITVPKSKKTSKITVDPILDEDEYENDDDDDEEDENYLQKFDSEISKNYISEQHPECAIHNYDEISKLTIIVRDNDGIIVDPLHKTLPFMTKYERARVLGQRGKQIECGANPLIKVPEGIIDAHIIAELELQQKKIPFIIRRPLPGGGSEYWNLKDLEMILF